MERSPVTHRPGRSLPPARMHQIDRFEAEAIGDGDSAAGGPAAQGQGGSAGDDLGICRAEAVRRGELRIQRSVAASWPPATKLRRLLGLGSGFRERGTAAGEEELETHSHGVDFRPLEEFRLPCKLLNVHPKRFRFVING